MIFGHDLQILRTKLNQYEKIVITGATGWLGHETAELLAETLGGDFTKRVRLVSSVPRKIHVLDQAIETIGWKEFKTIRSVNMLIHFAYLNQDSAKILGLPQFIKTNKAITADVNSFLNSNAGCDVLAASSGAAAHYPNNLNSTNSMEVYAALKKESEFVYLRNSKVASVMNMRIWNVTGSGLDIDSPYAVSNFFKQALTARRIELTGNSASTRTFIDVKEMMMLFLLGLESGQRITLDSGGCKLTFFELATKISNKLNLTDTSIILSGESEALSHYNPDPESFNQLARKVRFEISDIDGQLNLLAGLFTRKAQDI